MLDKEILEGNTLIGEFLGMVWINDSPEDYPNGYYISNNEDTDLPLELKDWEFHSSWQWLMPVVEKIESLPTKKEESEEYQFSITGEQIAFTQYDDGSGIICWRMNEIGKNKLFPTWECVIEFIKWYNQQNK